MIDDATKRPFRDKGLLRALMNTESRKEEYNCLVEYVKKSGWKEKLQVVMHPTLVSKRCYIF